MPHSITSSRIRLTLSCFLLTIPWLAERNSKASLMAVSSTPSQRLCDKLSESQILSDYAVAFSDATGLPLKFSKAGRKGPGMRGSRKANAFCIKMAENVSGCRVCVDMQDRLSTMAQSEESPSVTCIAGLTDSVVPVRIGDKIIGVLQTGQIALRQLTKGDFAKVVQYLQKDGVKTDWNTLENLYFKTRVVSQAQYDAALNLLKIFARHLSLAAEQIALSQKNTEPKMIQKARRFIEERHADEITLKDVARAVSTSTFHFCKLFKRATGLTFTEHLSMVRVMRAKTLLSNPELRVSEIAFQSGFTSLTHFNRVFKKTTGHSPSEFRLKRV